MLVARATMTEGRTLEQREARTRWTSAAAEELGRPLKEVRGAIYEKDEWASPGARTIPDHLQRVQGYLEYASSGAGIILGGGRISTAGNSSTEVRTYV